jgi:hypothetical protein
LLRYNHREAELQWENAKITELKANRTGPGQVNIGTENGEIKSWLYFLREGRITAVFRTLIVAALFQRRLIRFS